MEVYMEISTFNNTEFGEIRTIQKNGEVLFCGKDIAAALGYADPKKAIIQHCKENGVAIYPLIDSMGRDQQAKFITEGNLYRLIAHSKLPAQNALRDGCLMRFCPLSASTARI